MLDGARISLKMLFDDAIRRSNLMQLDQFVCYSYKYYAVYVCKMQLVQLSVQL